MSTGKLVRASLLAPLGLEVLALEEQGSSQSHHSTQESQLIPGLRGRVAGIP